VHFLLYGVHGLHVRLHPQFWLICGALLHDPLVY